MPRDEAVARSAGQDRSGYGPAGRELPRLAPCFRALFEQFQTTARAADGPVDRYYDLAGIRVLLRLALPTLTPLTRALAHRTAAPGDATLTVCVWESKSAPGPKPPLALASEWSARSRPGQDGEDNQIRALYVGTTGTLSMLDTAQRVALFWPRNPRGLPSSESAAPFLHIFTWWLARQRRYFVHAGAVGTPAGGVLLAGKGGAGKSTTALACLRSELLHVGDDYVLLSEAPAPFVYSVYQSPKLHASQLWRLPHLAARMNNSDHLDLEKALLFLDEGYAHKLSEAFPIRAILMPRVTGRRDTCLLPASAAQTLDSLIPTSVVELPGLAARVCKPLPESWDVFRATFLRRAPTSPRFRRSSWTCCTTGSPR